MSGAIGIGSGAGAFLQTDKIVESGGQRGAGSYELAAFLRHFAHR